MSNKAETSCENTNHKIKNFMNHTNCEVLDCTPANCANDMWTEITNIHRLRSQNSASVNRPVARSGGQNKLLEGQYFCFYYGICFKLTFLLGTKKFRDTAPECPHGYGLGLK